MTRLSDALHTAADDPVDLDLDALHARAGVRRRRRVRARAAGCVVAAVVAIGGLGTASVAGGDRDDVRAGETAFGPEETTTDAATESTTEAPTTTTEPSTTTETTAPPTTTPTTEAPPPTTEAPPPTTEAPPVAEAPAPETPAPETLNLHGTYVVENKPLLDPGCPELASTLEGIVTMDDGSRWTHTHDGCATIRDDVWRGEGPFALTAPDGASLTGTYLSVAPLPTDGVPYTQTVTGGTGHYAGATGECEVTVQITVLENLAQRQEGEITCSVTLTGTGDGSSGAPEVPESA